MGLFYYFLPLCKFHDGLVSHSREKFDNENIPSGEVITLPHVYVSLSAVVYQDEQYTHRVYLSVYSASYGLKRWGQKMEESEFSGKKGIWKVSLF